MARAKFENGWVGVFCPACEEWHEVPVNLVAQTPREWFFNGNVDRPSFTPSLKVSWTGLVPPITGEKKTRICHFFVRDGRIEFCADSTHRLSGQTVDLPEK